MFAILGWMLFGFLVGLIARACYPGPQPMGMFRTMLLGIGGSFVGGFFGYLLSGGAIIQGSGWIGSILGAVVLIALTYNNRGQAVNEKF